MASIRFIVLWIAVLAGAANAWRRFRSTLPEGVELGDSCTVSRPWRCGERVLLNATETELTEDDGFDGPNVCRTTNEYMQQTLGYTYQQTCFRSWRGQRCYFSCAATDECNGTMVEFSTNTFQCCEGFAQGEPMQASGQSFGFFKRFYKKKSSLRTDGCPVMLRDDVVECLEELELSELQAEAIQVPGLVERLSTEDGGPFTLFAPSNEAFSGLDLLTRTLLFSAINRELILSAHIGDGNIPKNRLRGGQVINTLAVNVSVHIGQTQNGTNKQFYVNGVPISRPNACQARNGVVHIIDDILRFSSLSIDDILSNQDRFSTFRQLAEAANVAGLLDRPKKSRTVFAPVDDAFDADLVQCLLQEGNRKKLSKFVLVHIGFPAEYASTLSQRKSVQTVNYFRLTINNTDEGILVTREGIPIIESDIPARNGVIHAISEVIQPFSDEKLERICPDTTTTAAPTNAPATPIVIEPATDDGVPGVVEPSQ